MKFRVFVIGAAVLGSVALVSSLAGGAAPGANPSATSGAPFKEIAWEALVPKEWDPLKRYRDMNLNLLSDSNPKVLELMRDMRATWDNAPTVAAMNGAALKLPGYVVPLEEVKGELKDFLLVPYFGACIHTPPPPANQIIHVVAASDRSHGPMDSTPAGLSIQRCTNSAVACGREDPAFFAPTRH